MKEEEYNYKVMKQIMKEVAEGYIKTGSVAKVLAEEGNEKQLKNNIEKISDELTKKLLKNLKVERKDLSKDEFERIVKKTVNEYFGGAPENKNKTK